jgi:hypothetical protein
MSLLLCHEEPGHETETRHAVPFNTFFVCDRMPPSARGCAAEPPHSHGPAHVAVLPALRCARARS